MAVGEVVGVQRVDMYPPTEQDRRDDARDRRYQAEKRLNAAARTHSRHLREAYESFASQGGDTSVLWGYTRKAIRSAGLTRR